MSLRKAALVSPLPFKGGFTSALTRGSMWHWLIASATGLFLGGCVLASFALPRSWALITVVVVLAPFVVMVVGQVQRFLLAIILLEIPLGIDVHLGYQEAAAEFGAVGGLNLSLTTLCLALLYALWLAQLLARQAELPPRLLRNSLPPTIYLTIVGLSLFVARDVTLAGFYMVMLLQAFLLYIYIIYAIRTREDVRFVIAMLLVGLALQGLIMIAVRFAGFELDIASVSTRVHSDFGLRGGGTIGSPNGAAGYLVILLAPALGVLLGRWGWRLKWLAAFAFGLGLVALLITQSRGGWAAFAISVALFYALAWYRGWLSPKVHLAALAALLLFAAVSQDDIATRLSADDRGAAYSRVPLMRLAFQIIQDNPLLGVGVNNFAVVLPQYLTPEFGREWIYTVHNQFLLIWAEAGFAALTAFLWFLATVLRRGWRVWKLGDPLLSPLTLGFTVAIVGHMAHMNVDIFNGRPHVQTLWLVAGLITAISQIENAQAERTMKIAVHPGRTRPRGARLANVYRETVQ